MTVTVDTGDMADLAAPYRRELLAHCYRMLGSVHDAEDAVQETMLRAWRGREGFESRSSVRVWLYRIATNACLRALERRARLPLPSGLGAPSDDPDTPLEESVGEAYWLEPAPDSLFAVDPADAAVSRAQVRLAFLSALQLLPARQRAALILRDVYAFSARETAEILETTVAGVNSALQRARAQVEAGRALGPDPAREPAEPERRRQLERYLQAFERSDIEGLTRILREDVRLEMPPYLTWFRGRAAVGRFLAGRVAAEGGRIRMVPLSANGLAGYASYLRSEDAEARWAPHAIHLLEPTTQGLGAVHVFLQPSLFEVFGLDGADGVGGLDGLDGREAAERR